MKMEIHFNVSGSERKRLVSALANELGCKAQYLGAPGFAYQVEFMTVSVDGTVEFEDEGNHEAAARALGTAQAAGFEADLTAFEAAVGGADGMRNPASEPDRLGAYEDGLVISVPEDKVNLPVLNAILASKGELIKKALGATSAAAYHAEGGTVDFPWWDELPDADHCVAYGAFIAMLCKHTLGLKRVSSKPTEADNEKYAFRCFLLRLGFVGAEYKTDRKILLEKLSGDAAFRSGQRPTAKEVENDG